MPILNQKGFISGVVLLILLLGIVGGVYLVQQKTNLFSKAFNTDRSVEDLTQELIELNKESGGRSAQDNSKVGKILTLANKRKEILLKEASVNPAAFLSHARLNSDDFPQVVQPLIEREVNLNGSLEVLHEDNFEEKISKENYYLLAGSKKFTLFFRDQTTYLKSQSSTEVNGINLEDKIVLESISQISSKSRSAQDFTPPKNVNLAVILFKFASTGDAPFTKESVYEKVISGSNSVKKYYEEISFNQISVSGQVFDWVTIDSDPKEFCETTNWENQALQKLKEREVDLSAFNYKAFVFPQVSYSICSFAGSAGGDKMAITGDQSSGLYSHELGHNLGMDHASQLYCHQKSIDHYANCQEFEYGDQYDVMGYALRINHLNAPHKASLGWIPQERIQTVVGDGVYKISPLEKTANPLPQVLRIPRPNINDEYYIEYRQPIGFDNNLPSSVTQGALIHIANEDRNRFTKLISASPNLEYEQSHALSDGQGFLDSINGISIQQLSHDSESVTVSIKFTSPDALSSLLLSPWKKTSNPQTGIYFDQLISANGYLFGLESYNLRNIYRSKIRSDGSLGEWGTVNFGFMDSPFPRLAGKGEYLYAASWSTNNPRPTPQPTGVPVNITPITPHTLVKYARLNGSGNIEEWKETTSIPGFLSGNSFEVVDNQLVALVTSPQSSNSADFYTAKINADGSLEPWVKLFKPPTGTNIYTYEITGGNGNLYLLTTTYTQDSFKTQLFQTQLNFSEGNTSSLNEINLPENLQRPSIIYSQGYLLLMGGQKITGDQQVRIYTPQYSIYTLKDNTNGISQGWIKLDETPLPRSFYVLTAVITDNKLTIAGAAANDRSRNGSAMYFSTLPSPSNLSGSCSGNTAQFSWNGASKGGQSASSYTLRVNKEPFDWAPNETCSSSAPTQGDCTMQVNSSNSTSIKLSSGRYGFSIQAGFADGTTSPAAGGVLGNEFNCGGSIPTPVSTPTSTPPP